MHFDSELFKRKTKCFRMCWSERHFLTFDKNRELFIEHANGDDERYVHPWYWDTPADFEKACEDLSADDWGYV